MWKRSSPSYGRLDNFPFHPNIIPSVVLQRPRPFATSSAALVSVDTFQVTHDCRHAHSHIITQPQSPLPFSVARLLIFTYILQPTRVHAHARPRLQRWERREQFQRRRLCPAGGIYFDKLPSSQILKGLRLFLLLLPLNISE